MEESTSDTKKCKRLSLIRPILFQSDREKGFREMGKLSYDETNTRFRIIEEVELGSTKDYYDTLYLYNVVSQSFQD